MRVKIGKHSKHYRTVWFDKHNTLYMIDQRVLPFKFKVIKLYTHRECAWAIKDMAVRGAGAIGAAAGFGTALAAIRAKKKAKNQASFDRLFKNYVKELLTTRPTAHDLFYAVKRVADSVVQVGWQDATHVAVETAQLVAKENLEAGQKIGEYGEKLIKKHAKVLTHCNAGWLAFVDWGSALSPIYMAKRKGKKPFVWVDETRPRLQGAKLTAWELKNENIEHAVIADNAAGYFMQCGQVDLVIVGTDRVAANGDVANKIGTYEKAVLAKENNIPFYVALPTSTIDLNCKNGFQIEIEERTQEEVLEMLGLYKQKLVKIRTAAPNTNARNPAFDITPKKYVKAFITEKGIIKPKKSELKKVVVR
jgi:S-methyl-5-thioribose-1-phosphate isomerase